MSTHKITQVIFQREYVRLADLQEAKRVELSLSLTQAYRDARIGNSGRIEGAREDRKASVVFADPVLSALVSPSLSGGENQVCVGTEGAERPRDVEDTDRFDDQTRSPVARRGSPLPTPIPPTSGMGSSINTEAAKPVQAVDLFLVSSGNSASLTLCSVPDANEGEEDVGSDFDLEELVILDYWHNEALTSL